MPALAAGKVVGFKLTEYLRIPIRTGAVAVIHSIEGDIPAQSVCEALTRPLGGASIREELIRVAVFVLVISGISGAAVGQIE